jgi:D-alanine transaminase
VEIMGEQQISAEELVWLNGKVMPLSQARLGLEDRGLNFADGVYEVVRFYRGRCFTLREHLERLERSADALGIKLPLTVQALANEIGCLVRTSRIVEGMIYLQLTRGEAPRTHAFPAQAKANLFFYARALPDCWRPGEGAGVRLLSLPDERWSRCWIKSLALLPNVLAKNQAIGAGCDEAVFLVDGHITECSASNLFCIKAGSVFTCPVGPKVLPGITRLMIQRLCGRLGIPFTEQSLPLAEALQSDEVFITSTTRELNWVKIWDNKPIAEQCGPITRKLHEAYVRAVEAETKG